MNNIMAELEDEEEERAEFYNFFKQNKRKLDEIEKEEEESEENIELSLGLSLNGQFGTELVRRKRVGPVGDRHVSVVVSQGSGSSGVSECEDRPVCRVQATSPVSFQSPPNQNEPKQIHKVDETELKTTSTKSIKNVTSDVMKNMMVNMPRVSTRDIGPNGKRTEGFLYQYKKGEEVRIVCICHGSSLTPAEFVKHAGGGDVSHPLKHIIVNPFPIL